VSHIVVVQNSTLDLLLGAAGLNQKPMSSLRAFPYPRLGRLLHHNHNPTRLPHFTTARYLLRLLQQRPLIISIPPSCQVYQVVSFTLANPGQRQMTTLYLSSGIAWDESCHFGISIARGSLYEACRPRANRWKQRWDETMGQTAIRCTDRKLPGSLPELRLTVLASFQF
jgi:hypothetical protein